MIIAEELAGDVQALVTRGRAALSTIIDSDNIQAEKGP